MSAQIKIYTEDLVNSTGMSVCCIKCVVEIHKAPYTLFNNNWYCHRCSRERLETYVAKLKFETNEVNELMEKYFPKKLKVKSDDINIATII